MKVKRVELLAPAGNVEGFYGAIHAGADAVYLGGEKFGARAYADNFTTEQLIECIRYAHLWGRKVYLTVNTLVKDKEWPELYDYILPFYTAGLDGVIIQDIGVFFHLKECFPGLELHVSTQMTLTGVHGAAYMKKLGACRIVPARELSLKEIRIIKEETGLEIEAFIHGAMCYCYSGQCLFSSILGGRSGNRGRCAQPCRLPYKVNTVKDSNKECYPLSLKDMCTIEHIGELIEAGIDSFKIEGRMKKPEYAAGVTAIYRRVIDRYYNHTDYVPLVKQSELNDLSKLYIRSERQNGYYHKHNGADMVTLESPAYSGSDDALLTKIREQYISKRPHKTIDIYGEFIVGCEAALTLVCDDISVTVHGDKVEKAMKQPITSENVKKQLCKLGDTVFEQGSVYIQLDDNAFYPLKAINDLRRMAVSELEERIIDHFGLCASRCIKKPTMPEQHLTKAASITSMEKGSCKELTVSVSTLEQLKTVASMILNNDLSLHRLYFESDLLVGPNVEKVLDCLLALSDRVQIFTVLPYIIRKRDDDYLKKIMSVLKLHQNLITGCMVRSLEGYAFLCHVNYQGSICSDTCFYIWNHKTLNYWSDKLVSFCLPRELNAGEQMTLLKGNQQIIQAEKIIYGHIPMMISAGCVLKTTDKCRMERCDSTSTYLTDRYQKQFPVVANCVHCMNIIYNSVPLSLHATQDKWQNVCKRVDFTIESEAKTSGVLNYFNSLLKGHPMTELPFEEYTTGHEKRGVE